jgi:hypothetical protein
MENGSYAPDFSRQRPGGRTFSTGYVLAFGVLIRGWVLFLGFSLWSVASFRAEPRVLITIPGHGAFFSPFAKLIPS